jgi:hypothetical protein
MTLSGCATHDDDSRERHCRHSQSFRVIKHSPTSRQHYGAERKHSVTEKQGCLMGDVQMSAICETDSKIEQSFIYDKLRVTRGANRKSRPH